MGTIDLEQPRLKLARARSHYGELAHLVAAYLSEHPFTAEPREEVSSGFVTWHARIHQPVPPLITLAAGDVIHNLRATLDYVVWQVILARGEAPPENTQFPVYDVHQLRVNKMTTEERRKKLEVDRARDRTLFGDTAFAIIDGMQMPPLTPDPPANRMMVSVYQLEREAQSRVTLETVHQTPLWMLHRLDAVDKHRVLNLVGGALRDQWLSINGSGSLHIDEMRGNAVTTPLSDDTELMRVKMTFTPDALPVMHFQFFLAFGDDGPGKGKDVLETCRRLIDFVDAGLEQFAQLT